MNKMEVQIFYQILAGLMFFGACSLGHASPVADSMDSLSGVQGDADTEYEYSDDESASNSHVKSTIASPLSNMVPSFMVNNLTVTTIAGKDAILKCPVENLSEHNVVLWYKGSNALTTGSLVLNKEYTLDTSDNSLKLVNVTEANQGEYYCEIQPQKIRLHTTLVVSEKPIENIVPENSESSQESVHFKATSALLTSSVIGIFLFLRI